MCGPEEIKGIAEASSHVLSGSSKFIDSLCKIRPGLAVASEARGIASANRTLLSAMEETSNRCKRMGLSDSVTVGMCMRLANEISKSENLSHCLAFAQEMVGCDYDASGIDHSWFIRWADKAEEQTDDEMRAIWGKLLAGELEQPGSYSKRTMSLLADMSADDAKAFSDLCSMGVYLCAADRLISPSPWIIMKEDASNETFNNGCFNYYKRSQMESLGVIDSSVRTFVTICPGKSRSFILNNRKITIRNDSDSDVEFHSSPVFTKYGMELSRLCTIGSCEGLSDYFTEEALRNKLTAYSDLGSFKVINNKYYPEAADSQTSPSG